jgi:hypothetical protein
MIEKEKLFQMKGPYAQIADGRWFPVGFDLERDGDKLVVFDGTPARLDPPEPNALQWEP